MLEQYATQVRLLLSVLPDIATETVFALKGGTAINLFSRMPTAPRLRFANHGDMRARRDGHTRLRRKGSAGCTRIPSCVR